MWVMWLESLYNGSMEEFFDCYDSEDSEEGDDDNQSR